MGKEKTGQSSKCSVYLEMSPGKVTTMNLKEGGGLGNTIPGAGRRPEGNGAVRLLNAYCLPDPELNALTLSMILCI